MTEQNPSQMLGMAKFWLYAEARSLLTSFAASRAVIDAFVRYGWISE